MPSRWWIPVAGIDPEQVQLEQLHAAVSRWFDHSQPDHDAPVKPYALSPLDRRSGGVAGTADPGFEVAVLTDVAFARLRDSGRAGREIRLGAEKGRLGAAVGLSRETWECLANPSGARAWELQFVTPATFRRKDRSSPWPAPASVLRGLGQTWTVCSGLPHRELSRAALDTLWVSDIDGHSEPMELSGWRVSGFVGRVRYQCDSRAVADLVDPLLRMATYSGVGSAKAKGLGVTRVVDTWQPAGRVKAG